MIFRVYIRSQFYSFLFDNGVKRTSKRPEVNFIGVPERQTVFDNREFHKITGAINGELKSGFMTKVLS